MKFKELSQEAQKTVIEGHIEYLNLTGDHKHTYSEAVRNLNLNDYDFDERGNRINSAQKE